MSDLANLNNQTSAVTTINNNSTAIETAIENTLSRDGTSPNQMGADLDLNGFDIINVGNLIIDGELIEGDVIADYLDFNEASVPSTPGANTARMYAYDESTTTRLAYKDSAGTVNKIASTASATTDNAITRFDGTAGLLQNSSVAIDDSGNLTTAGSVVAGTLNAAVIEMGNLDTTLTRSAAGRIAVEGVDLVRTTEVRTAAGANVTYYVRTDGSDSNTGLVDSAAGAFLTLQHAYNVISNNRDLNGFSVTIDVGNGTYTAGIDATKPLLGTSTLFIRGDTTTPANVIISVTSSHCILNRVAGLTIDVGGVEFRTTTAGNCLWAWKGSNIIVGDNCRFGASAGDHFRSTEGSLIEINANYTISGGAVNHWHCYGNGQIICQNKTITLSGTPAWSGGSFLGVAQGAAYVDGNTFSGSATGSRFLIHKNSYVDTGTGGSATYFPGNVAGTLLGGGLMDNIEGTIASNSSILSSSATAGIGYSTGAGDAVTQATSKTTTVASNNKMCGQITMNNAALGAGASVVFQTNNTNVDANDVVIVTVSTGVTANAYTVGVVHTGAGTFNTRVTNTTGGSLSDAVILNFAIIKCVTS